MQHSSVHCVKNVKVLHYLSLYIRITYAYRAGHAVAQWLRHCTTNRKVAGSIPDGVIGIYH
jgi:hypothetical protein